MLGPRLSTVRYRESLTLLRGVRSKRCRPVVGARKSWSVPGVEAEAVPATAVEGPSLRSGRARSLRSRARVAPRYQRPSPGPGSGFAPRCARPLTASLWADDGRSKPGRARPRKRGHPLRASTGSRRCPGSAGGVEPPSVTHRRVAHPQEGPGAASGASARLPRGMVPLGPSSLWTHPTAAAALSGRRGPGGSHHSPVRVDTHGRSGGGTWWGGEAASYRSSLNAPRKG